MARKRFLYCLMLTVVVGFFSHRCVTSVQATATVTVISGSPVSISADTYGTGAYTSLTYPKIVEGSLGDVGTGTIVLSPPSGFVFNTSSTVTLTVTANGSCKEGANKYSIRLGLISGVMSERATVTTTSITNYVYSTSTGATNCISTLTYTGIQVRPSSGAVTSGSITKDSSSTSTIAGITNGSTSFGTLSEVAGAKNKLAITTQPSSSGGADTNLSTNPVVVVQDQYGNTVTSDNSSTITETAVLSTQSCGGTAGSGSITSTPSSGSTVTAGVMTYTAWQYSYPEAVKICFTSSGLTSAVSNAITFLPAAPTGVAATDGGAVDKVTVTWAKATGATGYRVYRDSTDISGLLGDVATYDDTGAGAPSITPGTAAASDGSSTSQVGLSVAGAAGNNGTTHTYKVVAVAATGNSADSSTNTGYRGVGTLSYQWYKSSGDADTSYTAISGATASTYNDTAAPAPGVSGGSMAASDATSANAVELTASGQSTTAGAGRYYYATISASGVTSQDTNHDRGYIGVGPLTYQWQVSSGDSDAGYGDISGATSVPYSYTAAPADGSGRYYRLVVGAAGASNQTTAADRGYRAVISITITDTGTIGFGTLVLGETRTTLQTNPVGTKTVQNNGNIPVKFNISSSDAVGGTTWTLGTTIGTNIYKHEFSANGGTNWSTFPTDHSYATLATGVAVAGTQNFDLRVTTPSSTDNAQKTITVTIQATQ